MISIIKNMEVNIKNTQHLDWKFDDNCKSIYKFGSKSGKYFQKYEDKEQIKLSNLNELAIEYYRKAAIIHKIVRSAIKKKITTGTKYLEIVEEAANIMNKYIKPSDNGGFAFPLGISVNEISAHDSAMVDDDRILKKNDVVKIDLGIHVNGCIVDSAFTMIVDGDDDFVKMYTPLLNATADATYTGISMSRPDTELKEISSAIQEVIESYELENGTPIKAVWGLGGHNILPYKVHGGKLILCVPHVSQNNVRMKEDEVYAIETFASTGNGRVTQKNLSMCNHFMLSDSPRTTNKISETKNPVIRWVQNKNNNLPFTQLWCTEIKNTKEKISDGIREKTIIAHPPLCDVIGTYTSQLEHTIHIKENAVEILSLGKDY